MVSLLDTTLPDFDVHAQPLPLALPSSAFQEAMLAGLAQPDKAIPCRFLYDEIGSALFDVICTMPEYYPTRTEIAILRKHADDMARRIGPGARVIELGAGSGGKVEWLLDALPQPAGYVCIDISPVPLAANALRVAEHHPDLPIISICGNYLEPMPLPAPVENHGHDSRDICFYPGSTIGNFERHEAQAFLAGLRQQLARGAMMLVGVDLKKDIATLERAYDDAEGITASFSLNVLERANRELGADFRPDTFRHRARYIDTPGHIEISLVSRIAQRIFVAGHSFSLAEGEAIHIENSHKYSIEEFGALAGRAGFGVDAVWTDTDQRFSLHLLRAKT